MVAQERGIIFDCVDETPDDEYYQDGDILIKSSTNLFDILHEVSEWLGFGDVWSDGYLEYLPKEGPKIFERATY